MPLQYLFNVLNQYVSKDLLKDIGDLNISNIFIDTVNDNLQEVVQTLKLISLILIMISIEIITPKT
ncbi:hypothetical protein [Mycoplasmopsis cynos]|uniref:hypothetical protein n=1 Tax=Mycoplasmopsis cynos TaxID=171284 RepID=UPI0024CAA2FB|nr:hypothetical protein [Mycoplasmopsis cynos]WAM07925.1 hypothetical protein ONA21_00955 [Mycoplasmopsis cynos]